MFLISTEQDTSAERARVASADDESLTADTQRARFLEAMFDQLSDAVVLFDKNLQIVGANKAAERLFGLVAGEMVGKDWQDLFQGRTCDQDGDTRQGLDQSFALPTGTVSLGLNCPRHCRVVIRTVQLRDNVNAVEGTVATVKEITEEPDVCLCRVIAESRAMRDLLNVVGKVAVSEANSILIEGENGTGKDLIAKTLHDQSLRQSAPFLAIDCAAIPETLLESELFGYEKGAFTDARAQKRGLFELADRGTLFLDEIGEMPLSLQAKLLRVLEDQTFRRLGGLRDIHIDIRVIAATNRNVREAVKLGAFRPDLYYRLNVIQLVVPPLRERPQDILPLARFFVEHYNAKFKQRIEGLSSGAQRLLLTYDWPGNVRELRNAIERAIILEETAYIQPDSLEIAVRAESGLASTGAGKFDLFEAEGMSLLEQERRLLVQALETTGGNQTRAAGLLRISRDTLRYRMKKFNLR